MEGRNTTASLKICCDDFLTVQGERGLPGLTSLDQVLSASSPALPHVTLLQAAMLGFHTISPPLASAMRSLRRAELNGNGMKMLPPALSALTALESLDVTRNKDLQLKRGDVSVLAALPRLRAFTFAKKDSESWSQESLEALFGLSRSLPNLQMGDFLKAYSVVRF